jgi:hypothetical protein
MASFKGSGKGATRWWFLVAMHVQPQWLNMHLFLPLIDRKRGEPKMTPRLAALVRQLCHCVVQFTLRWIHPLGHREKLAYECPRLADPSREPTAGNFFNFAFSC